MLNDRFAALDWTSWTSAMGRDDEVTAWKTGRSTFGRLNGRCRQPDWPSALTSGACVCDSASAQQLGRVEMKGRGFIQPTYAAHIGLSFAQRWG
jgi:hypothetical protein